jgi:hypothetical protein
VQRRDGRARQLKLAARLQRHALPVQLHACVGGARRARVCVSVVVAWHPPPSNLRTAACRLRCCKASSTATAAHARSR